MPTNASMQTQTAGQQPNVASKTIHKGLCMYTHVSTNLCLPVPQKRMRLGVEHILVQIDQVRG